MSDTTQRRPSLDRFEKSFSQSGDCWDSADQQITVRQDDGGGGPYWIIETERWAISSLDELVELLERAGVERGNVP